ncbi:MAG: DUF480 domain-containing protein [Planctomycetales bacterium]|nr:DUF480 domain-containing protein [Planctomycetales bacterium]
MTETNLSNAASEAVSKEVKPLSVRQRRVLGVLMEKARTTPDVYPLSLNGLVTGCNQKSNRHPILNLTSEQVEDVLIELRQLGVVAEVHGGGRVAKYRHYGYDYLGVRGVEAAVMTELLLRGEQTIGELRTRASRFEAIAELGILQDILAQLMLKGLVISLTPVGRGQVVTHNLYQPGELASLREGFANHTGDEPSFLTSGETSQRHERTGLESEVATLREEVAVLRAAVEELTQRVSYLES